MFDLKADPYEEHNLIKVAEHLERFRDLQHRLRRIRGEDYLDVRVVNDPRELTETEVKKLKSLGYVE